MENKKNTTEREDFIAELYREFIIFWAILFFTCVVGIIELLPEFEKITGPVGRTCLSLIYFGLLIGILFSVNKCFLLYDYQRGVGGKFSFVFPDIDYIRNYLKGKSLERLLIVGILLVFIALYLVKFGLLK